MDQKSKKPYEDGWCASQTTVLVDERMFSKVVSESEDTVRTVQTKIKDKYVHDDLTEFEQERRQQWIFKNSSNWS